MSQSDSPFRTMFGAQRTAIKQGEQLFRQGLAFQRTANELALGGLKSQESFGRQGIELGRAATKASLGATAAVTGADGQRQTVDEAFSQLAETHEQFYDALERQVGNGVSTFDQLSDDYVQALDDLTEQLLETSQLVEDEAVRNYGEFSSQLDEQLERTQELQDELEDRFDEQSERARELLRQQAEQLEELQQQLEVEGRRQQQRLEEQAGRSEGPAGEALDGGPATHESEAQLELIDGLGPTFHDRLNDAGITTIDELVGAGPEEVAAIADVSQERAENWIDQATE